MRVVRIIFGYLVAATVFALAIPAGVIALGRGVDAAFHLPRLIGGPINDCVTVLLAAWGAWWMLWSYWFLVARGRGHPAEAFGIEVSPVTQQLVTDGPYAHTRNPMVYGYFHVVLAIAAAYGSVGMVAAIAALAVVGWVNLVFFEEPRLERRFGEGYREYKRRVPRFLPLGRR